MDKHARTHTLSHFLFRFLSFCPRSFCLSLSLFLSLSLYLPFLLLLSLYVSQNTLKIFLFSLPLFFLLLFRNRIKNLFVLGQTGLCRYR
jgi:hypothetical protein